jgi:uncharacterized tellurite resistance protein B-like protein
MGSWFDWLRTAVADRKNSIGDTETVRRIASELDKLDPARARYLAAFAYVLSRVAGADQGISDEETAAMQRMAQRVGQLPEAQAVLAVEIAKNQQRLFGGTENFLVTREFREVASEDERRDLLHCLFAVAAADGVISAEEDAQIWQIAAELGFTRQEVVGARLMYSAKRSVLRKS